MYILTVSTYLHSLYLELVSLHLGRISPSICICIISILTTKKKYIYQVSISQNVSIRWGHGTWKCPRAGLCVEDDNVINQVRILSITGHRDTAPASANNHAAAAGRVLSARPANRISFQNSVWQWVAPSANQTSTLPIFWHFPVSTQHTEDIIPRLKHTCCTSVVEVNNPHRLQSTDPLIFYEQSLISSLLLKSFLFSG